MSHDALVNRADYLSPHYLAEVLPDELKKAKRARDKDRKAGKPATEPRAGLTARRMQLLEARTELAEGAVKYNGADHGVGGTTEPGRSLDTDHAEWLHALRTHHRRVLAALGYLERGYQEPDSLEQGLQGEEGAPDSTPLRVVHAGKEYEVILAHAEPLSTDDSDATHPTIVAVDCGWATSIDAAFDELDAAALLHPVPLEGGSRVGDGPALASFLFAAEDPPLYVLLLCGAVVVLCDRGSWGEGRYLAVNLHEALDRNDTTPGGELDLIAALFGAASLRPPEQGGSEPLAELLKQSHQHAVGVSSELRDALRRSVEIIAGEVLERMRAHGVRPEDLDRPEALARRLSTESLRYLYRILFLLYAEARPELGILPANHPEYAEGYSLARLGELVARAGKNLMGEQAKESRYLYESLDLLFRMVNDGHRARGLEDDTGEGTETAASEGEGLRFEPLASELFGPSAITLIGREVENPSAAANRAKGLDQPETIDTRLRNVALHRVLRHLMITSGKGAKGRTGFISYARLGINELGEAYEGLMSYTGYIATEELYEVGKKGSAERGSWLVPASRVADYAESVVKDTDDDTGTPTARRYPVGSFVFRMSGRDRQTSASYYTPESLTRATVQQALRYRLHPEGRVEESTVRAREILDWTICEPALGSGAFLNEAINQVAALYLRRRGEELGEPPEDYQRELARAKAYIALHNSFGVDLNHTARELAEISLWLNVMHPGLQAPWFGLHLKRGNSLVGAWRGVYHAEDLVAGEWLKAKGAQAPTDHPFRAGELPQGSVHHFLLPSVGWGSAAGVGQVKELVDEQAKALAAWRGALRRKPKTKGTKKAPSQVARLQALAGRAEYLWGLVRQRLRLTAEATCRRIEVWGADALTAPTPDMTPEKRRERLEELEAPGTPYWRLKLVMDTWCALWFWPVDQAGLLDGTAPEYARESGGTRSRVPLADLDDWIEFATAVLGGADVQEEWTLFSTPENLDDLTEWEDQLPALMMMRNPANIQVRFPWLDTVRELGERHGFFHWELEFAHVFAGDKGGFDLQVGNPPWVRPDWKENEVLAEFDPWFKLSEDDKPTQEAKRPRRAAVLGVSEQHADVVADAAGTGVLSAWLKSPVVYPLISGTQPDLYRGFMCQTWEHTGGSGTVGLLHPDTHFSGEREAPLRRAAYRRLRLHADFVNPGHRFFPKPVGESSHFGIHVYGQEGEVSFDQLTWLFSVDALLNSPEHDGTGDPPGVRYNGVLDERPHRARIVRVSEDRLALWQRLSGETETPVEEARLLTPVSTAEDAGIRLLADYGVRLGDFAPQISRGLDEAGAKKDSIIDYGQHQPDDWSDVILLGIQLGVATPLFKRPDAGSNDVLGMDLKHAPEDAVPLSEYRRVCSAARFEEEKDLWIDYPQVEEWMASEDERAQARESVAESRAWAVEPEEVTEEEVRRHVEERSRRRYTEFYRMAWREWIASDTERSLYVALIPPGATHIHKVRSATLSNNRATALLAGLWSSVPVDYLVRIGKIESLDVAVARRMPAPIPHHPLAPDLLLRTLRLNCLTTAYAPLWSELYEDAWQHDTWAVDWPGLALLSEVGPNWTYDTPLRNEMARRAALVELDALVAVWLGLDADSLIQMYRARFPVLSRFEASIWFDADGNKLAGIHRTHGQYQKKGDFERLEEHVLWPEKHSPPEGFRPPFVKADREGEMRQAHQVFTERLRRGE